MAAAVAGGVWGRAVGPASPVDRHGQVVLAEGNDAAAEGADGALAPHPFLELEADVDAQPEDQVADLLVGVFVLCERRQVIDRGHERVDLFLRAQPGLGDGLGCGQFRHLPGDRGLFRHEVVERLGDGFVAGLVLLGGHPPLRGGDVVLEFGQPSPQLHEGGGFLGLGVVVSLRAGLRQEPIADSLAATGLVDELDERVDEHGRDGRGLDPVVVTLGVSAVVVAAAGVLQFVGGWDAVHDAPAAIGEIDDPRRERVALRIIRLLTVLPADLVDRRLLRLQGLPPFRIELGFAAAGSPHPHFCRIFEQLRLAVGTEVVFLELPRTADAHAAIAALGSPAILLDARDDRVRAKVIDRVWVPLTGDPVRRAVVTADAAGVGRRHAHIVQAKGDLLVAHTARPPFEDHVPDVEFELVTREKANVMAGATDGLAVLEPLHEGVVGADKRPAVSVGSPTPRAQPAGRHGQLDEDDPIAEPRRKLSMLLVLDQAADEICHLVGLEVLGRVDLVVGDEGHAAGYQFLLERHHLQQRLRSPQAVSLECVDMRHGQVGDCVLEEPPKTRAVQVAAADGIVDIDVPQVVQLSPLHVLDIRIGPAEGHAQ